MTRYRLGSDSIRQENPIEMAVPHIQTPREHGEKDHSAKIRPGSAFADAPGPVRLGVSWSDERERTRHARDAQTTDPEPQAVVRGTFTKGREAEVAPRGANAGECVERNAKGG